MDLSVTLTPADQRLLLDDEKAEGLSPGCAGCLVMFHLSTALIGDTSKTGTQEAPLQVQLGKRRKISLTWKRMRLLIIKVSENSGGHANK